VLRRKSLTKTGAEGMDMSGATETTKPAKKKKKTKPQ
jgi:hypothetical protein